MGTLSVRENLHFSAALRLPSRMTRAERKERVERVIDELGLRGCASTKVQTDCCVPLQLLKFISKSVDSDGWACC